MTYDDDFIGRLEDYLDQHEGMTPMPNGVRDAVRAALPTVKQIGPRPGRLRFLNMTVRLPASARYGLTAAAVAAVVLLGATFVGRGPTADPGRSPSPPASMLPTPTAMPSGPASLMDVPEDGVLRAGGYFLDHPAYPGRIELDVPPGWWYWTSGARQESDVHAILVESSVARGGGSSWGLSFTIVDEVRTDPCDAAAGSMDASATDSVANLVEAFSSWDDHQVTSVEDVVIGGYPGRRMELVSNAPDSCLSTLFTTPSGHEFVMRLPSFEPYVNQFTILDVEGSVLVVWTSDFPSTTAYEEVNGAVPDADAHAEDQPLLRDMLDSIVITPR